MVVYTKDSAEVFAAFDSAGNPRKVVNHDAQIWGTEVERAIFAFKASGGIVFATKSEMDGELDYDYPQEAWCLDPTQSGIYQKQGPSGSGSWKKVGDLPYSFIRSENTGAGTANAIQATTAMPIPATDGGALISLNIVADNTSDAPTVSFNGSAALTITDAVGTPVSAGGLTAGMLINGYIVGTTFRADMGPRGWSPLLRIVHDGERRVLELYDWTGGHGAKPTETGYLGATGLVSDISQATDIRGPQGPNGSGTGDMQKDTYDPDRIETDVFDWPKGFGADPAGDAATNDAAFASLQGALGNKEIDLGGNTYPVTAVPAGNAYRNGYFKVPGYLGDADVLFPQADTMLTALMPLTDGAANDGWPQDKWHVWNQQLWAIWTESTSHALTEGDGRMVTMRSLDGMNFGLKDQYKPITGSCSAWAAGCSGGVQIATLRVDSNGLFRLDGRRLPQRVELTDVIHTTAGQAYFYINQDDIDVSEGMTFIEGQTVQLIGVDNVGGLAISGLYDVDRVTTTEIRFTKTGMSAAASTDVGGGEFAILIPETDWSEIKIDGVTIGAAIAGFPGSPFTSHPVVIQSVAWAPGNDGKAGTFYTGASGNGGNAAIVKVSQAFNTTDGASIAAVAEITGADTQITEPTVICLPDGRLCGFGRTQDLDEGQTVPAIFWTSVDDLTSFDVTNLPLGAFEFSPISLCQCGDKIVAVASLQRDGNSQKGYREIVLLVADTEDAFTNGASAFDIIWIEIAWNANSSFGNLTNSGGGVGVPSIAAIDDKTVFLGFNAERESLDPIRGLQKVDIVAMKVGIGSANPVDYKGAARIAFGQVDGLGQWSGHVYGLPAVADGGHLVFEFIEEMDAPWSIDIDSDGYFTPPLSGLYEFSMQIAYEAGTAGYRYVQLVDESDTAVLNRFIASVYCPNATDETAGAATFIVFLRAGQKVRFKLTSAGGTVDSVARSFLTVRRVQ